MNGIQFILELSYVAARRRCTGARRGAQPLHPGTEPEVKWDCGEIERRNLVFIRYLHAKLRTLSFSLSFLPPLYVGIRPFFHAIPQRRIPIQNRIYRMFLERRNTKCEIETGAMKKMYRWQGTWISVLRDNESRLISGKVNENSL